MHAQINPPAKPCGHCGAPIPETRRRRNAVYCSYSCKRAVIEDKRREYRRSYYNDYDAGRESTEDQRVKRRAQRLAKRAYPDPQPCQDCGTAPTPAKPTERHHEDYSKPLVIRWLCRACHQRLERHKRQATSAAGKFS